MNKREKWLRDHYHELSGADYDELIREYFTEEEKRAENEKWRKLLKWKMSNE